MMYTGKDLEKRRIELNLSQKQIADMLNVDQSTVSRIENGLNDRLSLHIAYNGLLHDLERSAEDGTKES